MEKRLEITGIDQLIQAAQTITGFAGENRVWAFHGQMGAGKTTLIKTICEVMGVQSPVSSPTYSIVNEYTDAAGNPFYHFDFYRIRNIREAYDLGYENYFFSGHYCFIEWPGNIESLLDFPHLDIMIEVTDQKRIVTLHA